MKKFEPFTSIGKLDFEALIRNIRREGTPERVFFIELLRDGTVDDAIDRQFEVTAHLDSADPQYELQRRIAIQRFLGYEYITYQPFILTLGNSLAAPDTAMKEQSGGVRNWQNERNGIITNWEEFERYPWPDNESIDTCELEWLEKNLPDDMCIIGMGGHFCEYLCWLMGYETLCYALYDQRKLVNAIAQKILEFEKKSARILLQSKRVKIYFGSDDMGFKSGLMFGLDDMRELVLSGHRYLSAMAHEAGCLYILHSCGNRSEIIEDLIEDIKLDGIHSWEDTIELITDAKRNYGKRLSLLGGIDMDFICRSSEPEIRNRVRKTVEICQPGGGFCLGTGNSVANYIPIENYLIMLDEGRKWIKGR